MTKETDYSSMTKNTHIMITHYPAILPKGMKKSSIARGNGKLADSRKHKRNMREHKGARRHEGEIGG